MFIHFYKNIKNKLTVVLAIFIFTMSTGCTRRTLDVRSDVILHFRVTDLLSGIDISSTGEVESLDVFFFDKDMGFIDHQELNEYNITSKEPITIKNRNVNGWWISVWGNLKDGQIRPISLQSKLIEDCITLKEGDEGFYNCPDDLFFGIKTNRNISRRHSFSGHTRSL